MSFNTLKPEIWSHILSFLAHRLLKPLSGLTKEEYAHLDDGQDEHINFIQSLPDTTVPGVTLRKDIGAPALESSGSEEDQQCELGKCSIAGLYI